MMSNLARFGVPTETSHRVLPTLVSSSSGRPTSRMVARRSGRLAGGEFSIDAPKNRLGNVFHVMLQDTLCPALSCDPNGLLESPSRLRVCKYPRIPADLKTHPRQRPAGLASASSSPSSASSFLEALAQLCACRPSRCSHPDLPSCSNGRPRTYPLPDPGA